MSGTINYLYDPNQIVWTIVPCGDNDAPIVKEGKIIRLRAEVLVTGVELEYDVQLGRDNGTTPIAETDIFTTLNDAVVELEIRLT